MRIQIIKKKTVLKGMEYKNSDVSNWPSKVPRDRMKKKPKANSSFLISKHSDSFSINFAAVFYIYVL